MNLQASDNTFDKVLTCPYNPAHVMLRGRNQTHLMKCRATFVKDNPDFLMNYVRCSFNSTHIMPQQEVQLHEMECPDRAPVDDLIVCQLDSPALPTNIDTNYGFTCEENWDDECTVRPVLEMVQEKAKSKDVFLHKIGAPPAERKKHRSEETIRRRQFNAPK